MRRHYTISNFATISALYSRKRIESCTKLWNKNHAIQSICLIKWSPKRHTTDRVWILLHSLFCFIAAARLISVRALITLYVRMFSRWFAVLNWQGPLHQDLPSPLIDVLHDWCHFKASIISTLISTFDEISNNFPTNTAIIASTQSVELYL